METNESASPLVNKYFLVRHGMSTANEREIIISHPDTGPLPEHGLNALGRKQAADAAAEWFCSLGSLVSTHAQPCAAIVSSNFSRAVETATIFREELLKLIQVTNPNAEIPLTVTADLRERFFGDLEGKHNSGYSDIWALDETCGSDHTGLNSESPAQVVTRAASVFRECETRYSATPIFIVAHGDVLHILQTASEGRAPHQHRLVAGMRNAEVRPLCWAEHSSLRQQLFLANSSAS